MTIVKTITLYQFGELPTDKAKDKAREWLRNAQAGDTFWSEYTIEDAVEIARCMGIEIATRDIKLRNGKTRAEHCIFWSGFSSQGDGACFEGRWRAENVNVGALIAHAPKDTKLHGIASDLSRVATQYPEAIFTVKHHGHYYHDGCTLFDIELGLDRESDDPDAVHEDADAETELKNAARRFMRWIYTQLEAEYEYQNSDEAIDESMEANEYTFTASGKREDLED